MAAPTLVEREPGAAGRVRRECLFDRQPVALGPRGRAVDRLARDEPRDASPRIDLGHDGGVRSGTERDAEVEDVAQRGSVGGDVVAPQRRRVGHAPDHAVLDAQADAECLDPPQALQADRLGVGQRRARQPDGRVDRLPDVEDVRDGRVEDRVHVDGPAGPGQHRRDLAEVGLGFLAHRPRPHPLHVVAAEGEDLPEAGVAQHVVAEAGLDVADPLPDVGHLGAPALRHQVQAGADRQLAGPPHVEQGAVRLRTHPEASGVDDPGHAQRVQLGGESLRRCDLGAVIRRRDPAEDGAERSRTRDDAGRRPIRPSLDRSARRIGFRQMGRGRVVEHRVLVEELHVGRVLGSGGVEFGDRGAPALGEVAGVPATDHPKPRSRRCRLGCGPDALQALGEAGGTIPTHRVVPRQPGPDEVGVRVDEAGDRGGTAEIDGLGVGAQAVGDVAWGAGGRNLGSAETDGRHELRSSPDPPVGENAVGLLAHRVPSRGVPILGVEAERRGAGGLNSRIGAITAHGRLPRGGD